MRVRGRKWLSWLQLSTRRARRHTCWSQRVVNMTLDDTDSNIVGVLRTNPRITNKDIAERLDIAESTVAQRIRGM
ncbi:MAG: AsnC family transcriptional regulator, partial [Gammaproteobacteria bacterium]|nr:AsnC family transcriptional regulator [Gammaproteobacteria bacterium]